jgi:peptide/nickel transport system substrate-binding protein
MFNSLVKKDQNFDYVGELAKEITASEDGKTITFRLQDSVKFHNGKDFTSADVKYTFDQLFASKGYKSGAFFDTVPDSVSPAVNANTKPAAEAKTKSIPHIVSIQTPDPKTIVFTVSRPALKNQLLSNLVAIPIIAEGTSEQQKDHPIGTGPFQFVSFDPSQNIVELAANPNYWEGSTKGTKTSTQNGN